ncbi:MAG: hypothetical protein PHR51_01300 [Patescibacteria group bacterium]|nr:hypothetical protein [Patescibacteria group bacterium]
MGKGPKKLKSQFIPLGGSRVRCKTCGVRNIATGATAVCGGCGATGLVAASQPGGTAASSIGHAACVEEG